MAVGAFSVRWYNGAKDGRVILGTEKDEADGTIYIRSKCDAIL
jgi:hypothetical protein